MRQKRLLIAGDDVHPIRPEGKLYRLGANHGPRLAAHRALGRERAFFGGLRVLPLDPELLHRGNLREHSAVHARNNEVALLHVVGRRGRQRVVHVAVEELPEGVEGGMVDGLDALLHQRRVALVALCRFLLPLFLFVSREPEHVRGLIDKKIGRRTPTGSAPVRGHEVRGTVLCLARLRKVEKFAVLPQF